MNAESVYEGKDDVTLLDVREHWEWDAGRIDGALHIPLSELVARRDEIDGSRTLVVLCRTGTRSDEAAEYLRQQGLDAHNLDGGLKAWTAAGFPFEGVVV